MNRRNAILTMISAVLAAPKLLAVEPATKSLNKDEFLYIKHLRLDRSNLARIYANKPAKDIKPEYFNIDPKLFWQADTVVFIDGSGRKILKNRNGPLNLS